MNFLSGDWGYSDGQLVAHANSHFKLSEILKERNIGFQQNYHQKGWTHKRICPFPDHQEQTASFYFNPKEERFYCFGCSRGGQVVQFIAYLENKSVFDVAKSLIEQSIDGYQQNINIEIISDNEQIHNELIEFASFFFSWCEKNPEKIKFAHNLMWVLEGFLKKNLYLNTMSLRDFKSRIQFCREKLKEFECLEKY